MNRIEKHHAKQRFSIPTLFNTSLIVTVCVVVKHICYGERPDARLVCVRRLINLTTGDVTEGLL